MSAPTATAAATGDNGPDLVELTSNIGTWVAAFIAIVALVGVVGPFLALQASLSDSNRAMNAVQDLPEKYVTRGFRLTRGLRVLRRIRVPDLAPGYITNEPDTTPLVPLRAALGHWLLRPRDYLPWNTGWAKLAEVIEAHEALEQATNSPVNLGVTKGGTLEVVNSRTALVVNKHWILLLGLLGRYGVRPDKGILQTRRVRRDFEGERASIQLFQFARKETMRHVPEADAKLKTKRWEALSEKPSSSSMGSSSNSDSDHGTRSSDYGYGGDLLTFSLRRGAYGEWTIDNMEKPTVHGVTGTMQALGRHKGSWSSLTCISFVPHTAREIFATGTTERRDCTSMQTLFWLAHGFLPCGRTPEGRQAVISLEGPGEDEDDDSYGFERDTNRLQDWPAFSLQESYDIPISMGQAMKCLSIPEPKILQLLPLDTSKRDMPSASDEDKSTKEAEAADAPQRGSASIKIRGPWVQYVSRRGDTCCVFPRKDVERALALVLGLEWDDWGFLTCRDKFWTSILKPATGILEKEDLRGPSFTKAFSTKTDIKAFRWRVRPKFHPQKLGDYLAFDKFTSSSLENSEALPLRTALGTLFVLDASFRQMIENASKRICKEADAEKQPSAADMLTEQKTLEEALDKIAKEVEVQRKEHPPDTQPPVSEGLLGDMPAYTRFSRRHLDEETLRALDFEYEPEEDPEYLLVKRWVPDWEQSFIWDHTRIIRRLAELKGEEEARRVGVLEYDYLSKQLKWYLDKETMKSSRSWHLNGDLVRTPSSEKRVTVSEKEVALAGLWAANRAAMWLSSQDSTPLLKFVEELDPYVYVL
ncbi:hypothetical protein B0T10DRAFT_550538 [Thelonectria olida]|uniref:Uncharacterized protein n=1 Tax=Thelonectria olida TaxID=1576542 RepID=A0A9P8W1E3_9HYPO|nr:hypothetical protein B0T10DRAFT_550538 [Thelonectria olida]